MLADGQHDEVPQVHAAPSGARFHFSLPVHLLLLVIFGGMALGFGALVLQTVEEWRRAPAAPGRITMGQAAALGEPGPVAWVTLTDARWECARPLRKPSSAYSYGVVAGPAGERVIVALPGDAAPPCPALQGRPLTGRLERRREGERLPSGVSWSDLGWDHRTPGGDLILWTDWEPLRGLAGGAAVVFFSFLSLLGLVFFWAGALNLISERRLLAHGPRLALGAAMFRLPLSTGASALNLFSLSFGVFQVFTFGWLFFLSRLPDWLGVAVSLLAAVWVLAAFGSLIEGWKRRASDLLLGPEGFEIRGGPLHGVQHRLSDLGVAGCTLRAAPVSAGMSEDRCTLVIQGEVAAVSQDPAEDRSLLAIALTLQGAGQPFDPAAGLEGRPAVVCCAGCGAPVPPLQGVPCRYCGRAITLPEAVSRQVRAQEARAGHRAESEQLLRRLLRQPSAWRINALFVVALPPLFLGWPVAGALFDEFYQARPLFKPYHGVSLAVAALCANLALSFLLRAQVAARGAVRIIATHFAALPPAHPEAGEGPACRVCHGPLGAGAQRLVVLCGYCGAENVTGLNLVPVAAAEADQAGELQDLLRERLRERRRWRWRSLAALLLLLLSALSLIPVRDTLRRMQGRPGPSIHAG